MATALRWLAVALGVCGGALGVWLWQKSAPACPPPPVRTPVPCVESPPATPVQAGPQPQALPTTSQATRHALCVATPGEQRFWPVGTTDDGAAAFAVHCGASVVLFSAPSGTANGDELRTPVRWMTLTLPSPPPSMTWAPAPVVSGDVDGDGRADLLVATVWIDNAQTPRGGHVYLIRRDANGGWQAPRRLFSAQTSALALAELDGAPGMDIALVHAGDRHTQSPDSLWLFHGGPSPTRYVDLPLTTDVVELAVVDLNADSHPDIACRRRFVPDATVDPNESSVFWLASLDEAPTNTPPPATSRITLSTQPTQSIDGADLNGDGHVDLLLGGPVAQGIFASAEASPGAPPRTEALEGVGVAAQLRPLNAKGSTTNSLSGYAHPFASLWSQEKSGHWTRTQNGRLVGDDFAVLATTPVPRSNRSADNGRGTGTLWLFQKTGGSELELVATGANAQELTVVLESAEALLVSPIQFQALLP